MKMTGFKSKLAAFLSIAYGIGGFFLDLHSGDQMMDYIIAGIGILGVSHKIEKAGVAYSKDQTKELADIIEKKND